MANLLKGLKVNGTSYGIDYESLANRPVYKDITMGDYLLDETQLTLSASDLPIAAAEIDIQTEVESGDKFVITVDGEEYDCLAYMETESEGTTYRIGSIDNESELLPSVIATWGKNADGTLQTGFFGGASLTEGTYTVSIQKYTQEIKRIDREFLGLYRMQNSNYAKLDKNLSVMDFIGGILCVEEDYSLIMDVGLRGNGFIGIGLLMGAYTYNPASGYMISGSGRGYTYDVTEELSTSTTYSESLFVGAALVSGDGEPVMICEAEQSDTVWSLTALEQYLYDTDGNVVHDFSLGPVAFDSSTGEFTCNNGGVAEEILNIVDSPSEK